MRRLCVLLVSSLLFVSSVRAEENLNVLDPQTDIAPRKMLKTYLLNEAQKHFDTHKADLAALKSTTDIRQRQETLRAKFVEAIGGLPEKTPLNPQVVGQQQRDGYRIEKVIYESRPQHHITATLYLPDGPGKFPGVIMPIGHSANGKAAEYIQRGSILLAKHGIAVLAYDPIGQGERSQFLDSAGKPAIKASTSEHTLVGVGALLVGRCTASYRIWDGIRSLDYLASRPEIDPKRLGCTGCSGGGTLTSYLMALDDRIVAAAPSCYITSLERLFATIGPQDGEQNIPGQVAFGLDHADFILLHAPQPTLICAASKDFFDNQGTWTTFREMKKLYSIMGLGERMDIFESDTSHGFPRPQREATLRWMRRWLLHRDEPLVEEDFPIVKDADLYCTRTGQVLEDLKGRSTFDLNVELANQLAQARTKSNQDRSTTDLLSSIKKLINISTPVAAAKVQDGEILAGTGYRIRKQIYTTEPGILLPALLFEKHAEDRNPLIIYVHGRGKKEIAVGGLAEQLINSGKRILAIDLRGFGETGVGTPAAGWSLNFGADYHEIVIAQHLNRPLLGQRTFDLLSVIAAVAPQKTDTVELIGTGTAGPIALHAAALEPRVKQLTLDESLLSWDAVVRSPISHNQLTNVVHGALKVYDLPDLAKAFAPRPLVIRNALDPQNQPASSKAWDETYQSTIAAYQKLKAEKALQLLTTETIPERQK